MPARPVLLIVGVAALAGLPASAGQPPSFIGRVLLSGALSAASVSIEIRARVIQPGELLVLTITTPVAVNRLEARAFGQPVPAFRIDDHTWQALVGIDLAVKAGTYPMSVDAGGTFHTTKLLSVRRHRFPSRSLSVDDGFVNPPEAVQSRITREAAELGAIWQATTPERLWNGPFVRPVPGRDVSRFGSRSVFNGEPRAPHGGADFVSASGTPVLAPNAGRIVLAKPLYFTGNTVVIDHGLGLLSLLAHLSGIDVQEGAMVSSGQAVGLVGATGRVTGPHLHWAVRVGGARVDPMALVALLQ